MVTSRVIQKGDALILEINGTPSIPYGYMSYQPEKANYDMFRELGVNLIFVPVYAGDRGINPESGTKPFYDGFWIGKDEYDFSAADKLFRIILENAPPGSTYIIPRVMVEPPTFWEKAHPEALARDFAGASVHQSYSSETWFRDTFKALKAFCNWLKISGYDEFTAGIQLAGGHTEEFMRPITHPLQMTDYSEVSMNAWRDFLRETYKTVDALSAAWGFTIPDFASAPVPTPAQRMYTANGCGDRNAFVSDYYRFHSVEDARAICVLAQETKRLLGGNRVIGAFYGYCGAERGHTALDLILNCPDVDFLASPFAYKHNRPSAGDWAIPAPLDSLALHKKLWFMECDVRTHLSLPLAESMPRAVPAASVYYSSSIWTGPDESTSVYQLKKALAKVISHGCALWWFDMWGGWYDSDAYRQFHTVARPIYEKVFSDFRISAQTAVVADLSADETQVNAPDRTDTLYMLSMTGAPFRQYVLTDLELIPREKYRALILVNVYRLTDEQRALIERWMENGRSVIAISSPAFHAKETSIAQQMDSGTVYVYPDSQVYRFEAIPEAKAVREALLTAGVHVYNFTNDVIYACDSMVAINAMSSGSKRIYLPHKGTLTDAFTNETLEACEHFTDFVMQEGETRVFFTNYI